MATSVSDLVNDSVSGCINELCSPRDLRSWDWHRAKATFFSRLGDLASTFTARCIKTSLQALSGIKTLFFFRAQITIVVKFKDRLKRATNSSCKLSQQALLSSLPRSGRPRITRWTDLTSWPGLCVSSKPPDAQRFWAFCFSKDNLTICWKIGKVPEGQIWPETATTRFWQLRWYHPISIPRITHQICC